MTLEQIKEMINGESYDFLRTNQHLSGRIMFLTLGGSYAYGTNVETSDVDIRGCAMNSRSDLLGLQNFNQFVHTQTDTTIYGFNKLISLLVSCNPNTIELLGGKPEHYFYISDEGRSMIENRGLFLSKRAISSFGGYATQQLRRLENALARDKLSQPENEEHIKNAMERALRDFVGRYESFGYGEVRLFTDDSSRDDLDREVFCDVRLEKYPAREFNSMMNALSNVIGNYEKLNHRNNKKDNAHLNKHAMHLIRLYMMCLDILEKGEINTYRENERDFLIDIRNGYFQREDGTYKPEFFDMVSEYEKRLAYAAENTDLPKNPDMKMVEEFVMDINRRSINE